MRTPLQKEEQILLITHRSWLQMAVPAFAGDSRFGSLLLHWLYSMHWGWIAAL